MCSSLKVLEMSNAKSDNGEEKEEKLPKRPTFRYPHAVHADLKVNRYMPAKPKHWSLKVRAPVELGDWVTIVDDVTFHSRCIEKEKVTQHRRALIVGESLFSCLSSHERQLQLLCEETNELFYLSESEISSLAIIP